MFKRRFIAEKEAQVGWRRAEEWVGVNWGPRWTPGGCDFNLSVSCTVSYSCLLEQKCDSSLQFLRSPFPRFSGDLRRRRAPRCLQFRILKGLPGPEATKTHSVSLVLNKPNKSANKRQKKEPEECTLPWPPHQPLTLPAHLSPELPLCVPSPGAGLAICIFVVLLFKMTEKHSAEGSLPEWGFCPQKQKNRSQLDI